MTTIEITPVTDLPDTDEVAGLHIACCVDPPRFLCGAPHHPEAEAGLDDDEDDCCPTCVEVRYKFMCNAGRQRSHFHCPLAGFPRFPRCP